MLSDKRAAFLWSPCQTQLNILQSLDFLMCRRWLVWSPVSPHIVSTCHCVPSLVITCHFHRSLSHYHHVLLPCIITLCRMLCCHVPLLCVPIKDHHMPCVVMCCRHVIVTCHISSHVSSHVKFRHYMSSHVVTSPHARVTRHHTLLHVMLCDVTCHHACPHVCCHVSPLLRAQQNILLSVDSLMRGRSRGIPQ